ncbi:phosphodiester glycosidase family protein, partial [Bacillus mobilis]|uniref:phosphodiester glycosidase family protein n=2 Tax=Bacillati TaxID=1783272 RepID=UPI00398C873A
GTGVAGASTTPYEYDVEVSIGYTSTERPAPGVLHKAFTVTTSHGSSEGHLLEIDLSNPKVSTELLHAEHVAEGTTLTDMAASKGAFAAVNADFFNMAYWENNPGLATESADGPEITGGRLRKGAVPAAQRIGPAMSTGATGREVIGVGVDGRGRVDDVSIGGFVKSDGLAAAVDGYNQFALPQNGIGVYDAKWGSVTRKRATCGSDTSRLAPCLTDGVTEVLVRNGEVVDISHEAGSGQIGRDEVVLLGREGGAAELDKLSIGDSLDVKWGAQTSDRVPLRWAVGGFPNLADAQLVAGLGANNTADLAPGTAAGVSADGLTFYLVVVDGRSAVSAGVTRVEIAEILRRVGADDGVQLDRGGSTEMIMKPEADTPDYEILNVPSDRAERPFPNGIGVFVK